MDGYGKAFGLCLNPEHAAAIARLNEHVSCADIQMGGMELKGFDLSALKCTVTAFRDEEKCRVSMTSDGVACDFCEIENNGQKAGVCVSPELAMSMEKASNDIKCARNREEGWTESSVHFDSSSFRCTKVAFNDEEKCNIFNMFDDKGCNFCSIEKNGQRMGICVSTEQTKTIEKLSNEITCSSGKYKPSLEKDSRRFHLSAFKCTLEAFGDEDKCKISETSDGAACDYCSIEIDGLELGLCVSPIQAEQVESLDANITCLSSNIALY